MILTRHPDNASSAPGQENLQAKAWSWHLSHGADNWLEVRTPQTHEDETVLGDLLEEHRNDGFILLGVQSLADIERCALLTAVGEARANINDGATGLVATIQTPAAVLEAGTLSQGHRRLRALVFVQGAMATAMGVTPDAPVIAHSKSQILLAAKAAAVPALLDAGTNDDDHFEDICLQACFEGFSGVVACGDKQRAIAEAVFG